MCVCFLDTSLFPASFPRGEMKPWALPTSIARAQSGPWGRRCRVPCCEGPAVTLVVVLSQEGCERQCFIYSISYGSYRLQIGVNFSGIAAAHSLPTSCNSQGEGL